MVKLIGVKRWWQHVLCWFGWGCRWHNKVVKRGESPERMCLVPGCHVRQMLAKYPVSEGPTAKGFWEERDRWVTIKRDRRRKSGAGYIKRVK